MKRGKLRVQPLELYRACEKLRRTLETFACPGKPIDKRQQDDHTHYHNSPIHLRARRDGLDGRECEEHAGEAQVAQAYHIDKGSG